MLIELGGLGGGQDAETELLSLFEAALQAGLSTDGVIAQSEAQRAALWQMREEIPPEANRRLGSVSSHDISLPLSVIPEFLTRAGEMVASLGPPFRINAFGHLGDGNLHYNIFPPKGRTKSDFARQRQEVAEAVYTLVHDYDGSFSAEHGIGRLKVADLERFGDPAKLAAMRAIKQALDPPMGIMNPPGAVLRQLIKVPTGSGPLEQIFRDPIGNGVAGLGDHINQRSRLARTVRIREWQDVALVQQPRSVPPCLPEIFFRSRSLPEILEVAHMRGGDLHSVQVAWVGGDRRQGAGFHRDYPPGPDRQSVVLVIVHRRPGAHLGRGFCDGQGQNRGAP